MTKPQKLVLIISILAAFVSFLDGTVVNVALPAIAHDLGGDLSLQQWVVDAYLLTLGSLILMAGSLSDLFGRKPVLTAGLWGFGLASLLCALAPTGGLLIAARAVQGAAGALLVPSSLALIIGAFTGPAQSKAIGTWTAWTGTAMIVGPLLGGFLVDNASWRMVFAINVLPIAVTLWLMRRLPGGSEGRDRTPVDWTGAALCTLGLAAAVYALIEQPRFGWGSPVIFGTGLAGLALLAGFIWYERRAAHSMLPLSLFSVGNFSYGNAATVAVYAGLAVSTFVLVVFLQQVGHYSALQAGLSMLPVTFIMLLLSARFGALAGKFGPRWFMAGGPAVAAVGFLSMLRADTTAAYWTQFFPGIVLFGLGLAATVAPLTSAVLGDIDARNAGIGSAINNAVARIAGLVAVATLGIVIGPRFDLAGFRTGIWLIAGLLLAGGLVSAIGIRRPAKS